MEKHVKNLFELLFKNPEYQQTVERIARKHTPYGAISWEDAAQAVYEKIWRVAQVGTLHIKGVKEFYHWTAKVGKNAIIDMIRKEKYHKYQSLDENIYETHFTLEDTLADEYNLQEEIEFKDLVSITIEAIKQLDQRYPTRAYLQLWEGMKQGKSQSQLAAELGITQGTISKRRQELVRQLVQMLVS